MALVDEYSVPLFTCYNNQFETQVGAMNDASTIDSSFVSYNALQSVFYKCNCTKHD